MDCPPCSGTPHAHAHTQLAMATHRAHVDQAAGLDLRALALAQLLAVHQDGAGAVHILHQGSMRGHALQGKEVGGRRGGWGGKCRHWLGSLREAQRTATAAAAAMCLPR